MRRFVCIFALCVLCIALKANDGKTIRDIVTGKKITYTYKYVDLKNNRFNLFDEISIDYPIIEGYPKVNDKLYYYCVKYLETDSFKLELLQRAKLASSILLSRKGSKGNYSLYIYNNYDKFLPVLTDVDFEVKFLFDNILGIQIKYKYKIGNSSLSLDENFYMQRMFYFSLADSKMYTSEKLFAAGKMNALSADLKKKGQVIFQTYKKAIEEELEEDAGEDDEDEDEDEEGGRKKGGDKRTAAKTDTGFVINEFEIELNPFGLNFNIPEFSLNSAFCMGVPLQVHYTIQEIQAYIDPKGPLRFLLNYNKQFVTTLKNVNIFRETHRDWRIPLNLQFDNTYYVTAPAMGVKSITQSIGYKALTDSGCQKQKMREFDKDGKLVKESFYNSGNSEVSSSRLFEYNRQNLLSKVTDHSKNKKDHIMQFSYDAGNNLVERSEISSDGTKVTSRYYYDEKTAYEVTEDVLGAEKENIREYQLNEYGKIVCQTNFGEDCSYEILYSKDKELGSHGKRRPNLDNNIYCYSASSKLLTYQHDNGRHLYELKYDATDKITEMIHMDSRQITETWRYIYSSNGLLLNFIIDNGLYYYDNKSGIYRYKLDYEYY